MDLRIKVLVWFAPANFLLQAMAEHEAHHCGQLYLMASLRGRTVAPLFGLTEAQLAAASNPGES